MNSVRNFSKMCDCPEIQNQWKLKIGDNVANKETYEEGSVEDYEPLEWVVVSGEKYEVVIPSLIFVWLPNENQLKEITDFNEEDFDSFVNKDPYYLWSGSGAPAKESFETMEELLLAYVMKKNYGKYWRTPNWIMG